MSEKLTSRKALTTKNVLNVILMLGVIPATTDMEVGYINLGGGVRVMVEDGECGFIARGKGDEVDVYPARTSLVELTSDVVEVVAATPEVKVGKGIPIAQVLFEEGCRLHRTKTAHLTAHLN